MNSMLLPALALLSLAAAAPAPTIADADTRAWWAITSDLGGDAMEGRDTGSPGHARAVSYVAARFAGAGLKPAGEHGKFTQSVPLDETRVESAGTVFTLVPDRGEPFGLRFLHDISVTAMPGLAAKIDAPLAFRGYCGPGDLGEGMRGRIAVCFGNRHPGLPGAAERVAAARAAGTAGLIVVDDAGFTIEPPRWPEAYARAVTLRDEPLDQALPIMRLNAAAFARVIQGAGQDAVAVLAAGSASQPLRTFDIPARLHATLRVSHTQFRSDNVLGLLPGTDPGLAPQVVIVSAHLDGYGYGEAVAGDRLYNGAFDDAAYVATIIRLAEARHGRGFRRSLLFAAFTGEEKGLLGARWFVAHPTVGKTRLVADINLDQLRPLFPLRILTMHALDDTTLGADARAVAAAMRIEIRADREPDRGLLRRADHWPFLQAGIPATGFVFGYDPGTGPERKYREWYRTRYHRPQDDLGQSWDPVAARDFNRFFYALTGRIADAPQTPSFLPASELAPR